MDPIERKFNYVQKPRNGMILHTFIKDNDFNKYNHPAALSEYDWNRKFNVNKLRNKWKQQAETDFEINEQKFPYNIHTQEVLDSRKYVNDLIENDVLEIKKKRWNVSSSLNKKEEKKDHKKNIYELKNGLVSFSTTPKYKKKKPMESTSRDPSTINLKSWNKNTILDKDDKKDITNRIKHSAKQNTRTFWNEHKDTSSRIGTLYTSPYDNFCKDVTILQKVKEDTKLKKEEIEKEVRYLNPGAWKYPEKIQALVYKEMRDIYKEKLDNIKLNKSETEPNQPKKNEFCDAELSEKIQEIKVWKEHNENKHNLFQTDEKVQDYLIPLINKSTQIKNKESEVITKRKKDNEIELKKEKITMKAQAKYYNYNDPSTQPYIRPKSRFPINEFLLEDAKKNINFFTETFVKRPLTGQPRHDYVKNKYTKGTPFLEAYKKVSKVAVKEFAERKEKYNKKYTEKFEHLGAYRIFQNEEGSDYHAWSCCMKEDKNSQGCQRILDKKHKWCFE